MKKTTKKVYCQKCGKELKADEKPCPICGSFNRNVKLTIEEELKPRSSLKVRQKRKGWGKFIREIIQGWFQRGDKRKYPKGVEKKRIIDKEKDYYKKEVKDLKTGKITKKTEEPLSKHRH